MSWLQVIHFVGAILFIAGLLLFADATIRQTILEAHTLDAIARFGPAVCHPCADPLQQQQLIGGLYAAVGGGLARLQRNYQV